MQNLTCENESKPVSRNVLVEAALSLVWGVGEWRGRKGGEGEGKGGEGGRGEGGGGR